MSDQPISLHTLTGAQFEALSSGAGDPETIRVLVTGQRSKWLLTLGSILESVDSHVLDLAIDLLERARLQNPETLAEVITYPHVGMWAWVCLETAMGTKTEEPLETHLLHLNAIAAVAAHRCGVTDFELAVPVRDQTVMLPTLGQVCFVSEISSSATLSSNGSHLCITTENETIDLPRDLTVDSQNWEAIRHLEAEASGLKLAVAIDDLDPYRHYYEDFEPSPRLTSEQLAIWKAKFTRAWALIARDHPSYATGMAVGLKVLVPVKEALEFSFGFVTTSPYAFGAIALNETLGPEWFAYRLIHQFQHAKFDALHDYLPLHRVTHDEPVHYVPWHWMPRSFRNLFEGIYKGITAMEFWDNRRIIETSEAGRISANVEFSLWHNRFWFTSERILRSGELTQLGFRFVETARETVRKQWSEFTVDKRCEAAGRFIESDFRISWRLRHLRTDVEQARQLAAAWLAGMPCPGGTVVNHLMARYGVNSRLERRRLTLAKLEHSSLCNADPMILEGASSADIALIEGDLDAAVREYEARIAADPEDRDAWAGLTLAMTTSIEKNSVIGAALDRHPEVVQAVYYEIWAIRKNPPDLNVIAAWLSPLLTREGVILDQLSSDT